MIPVVFYPLDFFTAVLLKTHNEETQSILRRQRNFRSQMSICVKDRKAFNSQNFQQLEPKTIFSALSR